MSDIKTEKTSDYAYLKILVDRNEPKISFGEPKFTKYEYVHKKDGRRRIVVKCEIESERVVPNAVLEDSEERTSFLLDYPTKLTKIRTIGRAVCDERDEAKFNLNLGKRVARVRAEKRAFERHACAIKSRVGKLIDFYQTSLDGFLKKAAKVDSDPIIWEVKEKK